ncbi:hypothetical protein Tco_0013459 [Tanacetum coccineum]
MTMVCFDTKFCKILKALGLNTCLDDAIVGGTKLQLLVACLSKSNSLSYCSAGIGRNGYLRKGRKTKPKRQNRTRNGKAWKRQSQDQAQVSKSQPKSTPTNPEVNK